MSHPHTRKSFLGRLLATLAIGGSAPKLLAGAAPAAAANPVATEPAIKVQPERRAVARRSDTV